MRFFYSAHILFIKSRIRIHRLGFLFLRPILTAFRPKDVVLFRDRPASKEIACREICDYHAQQGTVRFAFGMAATVEVHALS